MMSDVHSLLLGFPECRAQAGTVADLAGIAYADIGIHVFPDGESKITLPQAEIKPGSHVLIYRSLDHPNAKLVELILAAEGAKRLGAATLTLIVPYLSYMRQDMAFNPGEVISQTVIGHLLAGIFDAVLTVDSHLHRIQHLSEAIPAAHAINLTATAPMAAFLAEQFEQPYLLGPDAESEQWVRAIAAPAHWDYGIAHKERLGDRNVVVTLPEAEFRGRDIVLVDDVASSGQTLIAAARQLAPYQPRSIAVLVTHALFRDDSEQQLHAAGVGQIWSCDSIIHRSNRVPLAGLLAENLPLIV
jgi:ribose-phosphate pyrophosphokinase